VPAAAVVSFRLGGTDGVSVEAAKWCWALSRLGYDVRTVAGAGVADCILPELAMDARDPPRVDAVAAALAHVDLVIVENLCSLPLNPAAARAVADVCHGRPAVLHHHDLPWQRPQFAEHEPPPDDPAWRHVTINDLSRAELAAHGIGAVRIYNAFDLSVESGARRRTRHDVGFGDDEIVALQPTRALLRKNVAGGLSLADSIGATYWLLGPAEDGYGPELDRLVAGARCPVRLGNPTAIGVIDAYAACDVVVLPSTWEGFGNPAVESAVHRRPLAIGPYPVGAELASLGFEWFAIDEPGPLRDWLDHPDPALLQHNRDVAAQHFSLHDLPRRLEPVLASVASGRHEPRSD
jgi:glycosyltransferase involved in cell wall biosynthesis